MIAKSFKITIEYEDEDLPFIAEQQGLSLEQLTDEKLAEFVSEDLTDVFGVPVKAVPGLTPAPQG